MKNSLTQYLDLIRDAGTVLEAHSPELLNRLRPRAVETLEAFGRLPRRGDEGFPEVSPEEMFAPDFGLNLTRIPLPADPAASFRCDVPQISTLLAVVAGDSFYPADTLMRNLPQGMLVCSFARALQICPEILERNLNTLAANRTPTAALNTALLEDGVFLYLPRGVQLDKAVQIVNIFNMETPQMAVRRILIVAEEGASGRILLCDHARRDDTPYLSSQVVEVVCGRDSSVELYDIEETSALTSRMNEVFVRQESGSHFSTTSCSLLGGSTLNSLRVELAGEGAEAELNGAVIASGERRVANAVHLSHKASRCRSRQLFKYALFDSARGAFGGKVVVAPGAVRTDAVQSNRNLLTGPHASMHTDPQLEIYCDDVKAGHGATTGNIDPRALFYMQQRGIPREEAERMLVQAFMMDAVDGIRLEVLRDRMRMLVEKRLGGDPSASCSECRATCK